MTNPKVDSNGTKCWFNSEGQLHRTDGPAIEYVNGTKCWYLNGKRHREDGPAIERADESKEWFLNGERHREDGPAVEYTDGYKYWFLNGEEVRKQDVIKLPPIPVGMSPTSGILKMVVERNKNAI